MQVKQNVKYIMLKIRSQVSESSSEPESELMLAILERALLDLFDPEYRLQANNYLSQCSIKHAEIIGVSTNYIQRLLTEQKLLSTQKRNAA